MEDEDLHDFPTRTPQDLVKICIEDNGIGFDNNFAEEIFKSFTRLNSKNLFEGSGVGLAICKKIIENHQGIIKAFGRKNKGARFTFIFPISPIS